MPAACGPTDDARADSVRLADSDAELLRLVAGRDRGAFERLYRRYARPVYGLALRTLADRKAAADATRRTFAAVWASAAAGVPEGARGDRFIFAVACAELDRTGGRPPDEGGWPAFRVHAAVGVLPEHERTALELAYWSGRSLSEVADVLGLPVDAVEARTRSALAHLAARLAESDGEPQPYFGA
jgi:RNA polymerase sigma-70 factor (ECF subfamily)